MMGFYLGGDNMQLMSKAFVIEKAGQLNSIQHKLFTDYGLRQVKWMFEKDDVMKSKPPKGSVFVGLSQPFSRWTAVDQENRIRYGYFKGQDPEWSEANDFKEDMRYDRIEDFKFIYNVFNLESFDFDVLTHVHRNYLEW